MDWLIKNIASIECKAGKLKFINSQGEQVVVTGTRGDPKLHLVLATKLLKAYQKKQMIYAVKLNPIDKPKSVDEPEWLSKFDDVFPEELTQLPPYGEVDHAIEPIPGAQPIARRPYKMSLPEAIELKEQLKQLIDQGFIKPKVSPWSAPIVRWHCSF